MPQVLRYSFCTSFTIYTCRNNTSGIASTLTTGEEALNANMLQCISVSDNPHWTTRPCLYRYHDSLIRQKTVSIPSESLKPFLQTF
jgi:hypothetical protein